MTILKRTGNNDVGTPTKVGGNDWDELYDYLNGVNLSGKSATILTPTTIQNHTINADLNAISNIEDPEIKALANIAYTKVQPRPSETFLKYAYWWIFIDPDDANKIKGTNGVTSYESANDVGYIFNQIFGNNPSVPLHIFVGPGSYDVRTFGQTNFRRGNFKIRGCGSQVTEFRIHNDLQAVNGTNRAFSFEADPNTYSEIAIGADVAQNAFAVLTDSTAGLTAGCHVVIGSDLLLPLASAKTGEHNRIVKIVATGGTPAWRIILEKHTRYPYAMADGAWIRRVDFLENMHFEGFTIKQNGDLTNSSTFIRADFAYNLTMEDVHLRDWAVWNSGTFHAGLVHNCVVDSYIHNCIFEQSPERGHDNGANSVGYAISSRGGSETVWYSGCRFIGQIRHAYTTTANGETAKNGHPINIWIVNCNSESTTENSFDSHGEGDNINFINCSVHSTRGAGASDTAAGVEDNDAFGNRCNRTRYINCTVDNCNGTAFSLGDGTKGHQLMNCKATNIYLGRNAFQIGADDSIISNCSCDNVDQRGLLITSGAKNVVVNNFRCSNVNRNFSTQSAIRIDGSAKNISLSQAICDVTNNATTGAALSIDASCEDITLSHIQQVGGNKRCTLDGMNIKLDEKTCIGGGLGIPLKKEGSIEMIGANGQNGFLVGQVIYAGGSKRVESTDGLFSEFATSTLNLIQGFKSNNITERDLDPYYRITFRLETDTNTRLFLGFMSNDSQVGPPSAPTNNADPLLNQSGFGLFLAHNGTNFVIYHNSGGASTTTGANIATKDTNKHVIELRANNGASGFQWRWDHGAWSSVVTTNVPAATTDICLQGYMENVETGVTKTLNLLRAFTNQKNMEFFA